MIKNIDSLKDKAKNCADRNNLSIQQVLQNYMFERFLDRLSQSRYNNNFVIKGGLLLSSIMGINMRTTMDIDIDITGINFEKDVIEKIIGEIIEIDVNDGVTILLNKVEDIKEQDEYGGYKFKLIAQYGNLKIPFHIDISTGDIITPRAIQYRYNKILENEYINIWTYNQETLIAEKLQTILARKLDNSRMKDFYDLYYFEKYKWNEIDKKLLVKAIQATFRQRTTTNDLKIANSIIKSLEENQDINSLWNEYRNKFSYAEHIKFVDTLNAIRNIVNTEEKIRKQRKNEIVI